MTLSRTNAVLVVVAVALALVLVWDRARMVPPAPQVIELPAVDPEAVDRFVLVNPAGRVEGRKVDGEWRMIEPRDGLLDDTLLEGVMRSFGEPLRTDVKLVDEADDPEVYGLDDATRVQLEFFAGDQRVLGLELGRALAGGSSVVRVMGDGAVYRARIPARFRMDKDPLDWRDHAIIDLHAGHVVGITVIRGDDRMTLQRRAEDWVCLETPDLMLDARLVESIARSLASLRAHRLVDDPPESAFDDVVLRLVLTGDQGVIREIDFGALSDDGQERFARAGDRVFTVAASRFATFDRHPSDLRDRDIVKLDTEEVVRVTLERGAQRFAAQPTGEYTWELVEPRGYAVDTRALSFSLNGVIKLRAHELDDGLRPGDAALTGPGALAFTIERVEAAPIVVRIGPLDEEPMHACLRDDREQGYRLRASTVRGLVKGFGLEP